MIWFGRNRKDRLDPVALSRQAQQSIRETDAKQPRVNAINSYLRERHNKNGFGEDFEYTLRTKPRGAQ